METKDRTGQTWKHVGNEKKKRRRDIAREGNHREDTIQRMQRNKVKLQRVKGEAGEIGERIAEGRC